MIIAFLALVGVVAGTRLGIFSLALMQFVVCTLVVLDRWSLGVSASIGSAVVAALIMSGGFAGGLALSYLLRPLETGNTPTGDRHFQQSFVRSLLRFNRPH